MLLRLASIGFCSLALLACGNDVAISAASGHTGGVGGAGGTGGSAGDTGGAGGMCARTTDSFAFTFENVDGVLDCTTVGQGNAQTLHTHGMVTASGPTTITFDACPPNADCGGPLVFDVTVESPGFAMNVAPGTFVQVDVLTDHQWGCVNAILVRNLPVWSGMASPGGDVPWLIFEGSDGASQALEGSPFSLTTTALGCHPNAESGCGKEDEYRFDINAAAGTVPVYQGETKSFDVVEGGAQRTLLFRNLRSFETGACDDDSNWAHWVVPAPLVE